MTRVNQCPRRLRGVGLAAVLLAAGAALPLAPSLAREDVAKVEEPSRVDEPKTDRRELILLPAIVDPTAPNTAITFSDEGSSVVASSPDTSSVPGWYTDVNQIVEVNEGDVERARIDVERLSAALADAKARLTRLKELEKREKEKVESDKARDKASKDSGDASPKTAALPRRLDDKPADLLLDAKVKANRLDKGGDSRDQERRIEGIEQRFEKLDKVLDELKALRAREHGKPKEEPISPKPL